MAEEKMTMPHKVTMEERKKLTLTGATEILHFDGELARIATQQGMAVVHGRDLKLKTLSLEGGVVSVTGQLAALIYEEPRRKGRWLG